jgi:hypothetical protein
VSMFANGNSFAAAPRVFPLRLPWLFRHPAL